jgi:hypothetical protein
MATPQLRSWWVLQLTKKESVTAGVSHIIPHGTTHPGEIVCDMCVTQLLQTLSSLTAEHKLIHCGIAIFTSGGI